MENLAADDTDRFFAFLPFAFILFYIQLQISELARLHLRRSAGPRRRAVERRARLQRLQGRAERGVLVCGSGVGASVAAMTVTGSVPRAGKRSDRASAVARTSDDRGSVRPEHSQRELAVLALRR